MSNVPCAAPKESSSQQFLAGSCVHSEGPFHIVHVTQALALLFTIKKAPTTRLGVRHSTSSRAPPPTASAVESGLHLHAHKGTRTSYSGHGTAGLHRGAFMKHADMDIEGVLHVYFETLSPPHVGWQWVTFKGAGCFFLSLNLMSLASTSAPASLHVVDAF